MKRFIARCLFVSGLWCALAGCTKQDPPETQVIVTDSYCRLDGATEYQLSCRGQTDVLDGFYGMALTPNQDEGCASITIMPAEGAEVIRSDFERQWDEAYLKSYFSKEVPEEGFYMAANQVVLLVQGQLPVVVIWLMSSIEPGTVEIGMGTATCYDKAGREFHPSDRN
ncbi:MAG: hypothetical protein HN726_03210 [Candidatus Magasanikbacteria bacterium]|jgi:hypothetical protein|nr:hypothetical protein [Candidatus Magasanikbacteria bacterium]MBT4350347.1 hypothetical protein [Candidatus Magasanikbacteria bacterium]MBT4542194.1 hypothetical protein [Candidatus Magasanikbacteria bacterium]MBT6252793.1 hypothetical protein [Candidatus Magasanikbacteria bacterium]MBT7755181.1 hypothetical protein [Candidatus Magasanikbacteria bacterium]